MNKTQMLDIQNNYSKFIVFLFNLGLHTAVLININTGEKRHFIRVQECKFCEKWGKQ